MIKNSQSFDELLMNLPREEQVMVKRLRALIMDCIPKAREQFYYDVGIPFYRHNKLICFIRPASTSWGSKRSQEEEKGTSLGFNQGYLMANKEGVLLAEGRKQVYMMYFKSLKDIDENQVCALLFEAAMIDQQFGKKKKKSH